MCGILCEVLSGKCYRRHCVEKEFFISTHLLELLRNRGPDAFQVFQAEKNLMLGGFVLSHQGEYICRQPIENELFICIFNGDIYNTDYDDYKTKSDSYWLFRKLSECRTDCDIFHLLESLEGSFSIIIYDKKNNNLYFTRDKLGRNSLIFEIDNGILRIISNSFFSRNPTNNVSMEIPSIGLYKLNIFNVKSLTILPWEFLNSSVLERIDDMSKLLKITIITKNVRRNWINYFGSLERHDVHAKFHSNRMSSITKNKGPRDLNINLSLCSIPEISQLLDLYLWGLEKSVKTRVETTSPLCNNCIQVFNNKHCKHSKIALLFSGGVDCTILAVLIHKFANVMDSVDLVNVAFQAKNKNSDSWDVPDRCTAKKSLRELKLLCPQRTWNFVEVNVSRLELETYLNNHIKDLIFPLNTVLDESIGCAFWFASRGVGFCNGDRYTTSSRVVIVGSGADELFGGYTRHRNAYNQCNGTHLEKLNRLQAELDMDWKRIPHRNLGRDDRVIADNGKTVRAPFIEESLVSFVQILKPEQRCCFTLDFGKGDKLFLRLCGHKLGLREVLTERKRAIQFGSRIAWKKQHCSDKSSFL